MVRLLTLLMVGVGFFALVFSSGYKVGAFCGGAINCQTPACCYVGCSNKGCWDSTSVSCGTTCDQTSCLEPNNDPWGVCEALGDYEYVSGSCNYSSSGCGGGSSPPPGSGGGACSNASGGTCPGQDVGDSCANGSGVCTDDNGDGDCVCEVDNNPPPPPNVNNPKGALDAVTCNSSGVIGVAGWTGDNDVPTQQLTMKLYVDDPTANVASNKMGEVLGDKFISYTSALAVCNAITNNNSSLCSPCGATDNSGSNLGQCKHRTNSSAVNTSFPGRPLLDDGLLHNIYGRVDNAGGTGSGYTIVGPRTVQCLPNPPACSVTIVPISGNLVDPTDNDVQITVIGNGSSGNTPIEAHVVRWPDSDGTQYVSPSTLFSGTAVNEPTQYPPSTGIYYYKIPAFSMTSVNGGVQSNTATLNILEPGEYAISCNVLQSGNPCSGNPYCTYKGGTYSCTGFDECSATNDDYKFISVAGTISGTIYYDPNNTCSTSQGFSDTYDVFLDGGLATKVGSNYSKVVDPGTYNVQLLGFDSNTYKCSTCGGACPIRSSISPTATGVNFFLTDVNGAWWRVAGGDAYAGSASSGVNIQSIIPIGSQYWLNNDGSNTSPLAMHKAGDMYFGSLVPDTQPSSGGQRAVSTYQGDVYDFNFWKAYMELPLNPTADVTGNILTRSSLDALGVKDYYYVKPSTGTNVTLSSLGNTWVNVPATPTKYVIFIEGDLIINSTVSVNANGFLMFIVSGSVTIQSGTNNVEAIIVSDGAVTISPHNQQLQYEGSLITWSGITLGRDLGSTNDTTPAELFTYRADFLRNMPEIVKVFDLEWQEVAPGSF